jgi:hypothetical protein
MYTNKDSSNFNFNLYSRTTPRYGIRGGSRCVSKCTEKCAENCSRYCKIASEDSIEQTNKIKSLEDTRDLLRKTVNSLPRQKPTPVHHHYYTNYPMTYRNGGRRRVRRKRTRKGGFGFFGSTPDLKPCEIDCKSNCSQGCTTLCDNAVKYTISKKDKEKMDTIRSEIELLRRIIATHS